MPSSLYPFSGQPKQNESSHNFDQYNIYNDNYMMPQGPLTSITILGSSGEPIEIPIDQLPQFLQDMAQYEPEMFNQLMANMDEDRLNQFIEEQEL